MKYIMIVAMMSFLSACTANSPIENVVIIQQPIDIGRSHVVDTPVVNASIDGNWAGKYSSSIGDDTMYMEYTFKAEENFLTGTSIGSADGSRIPIKDGIIDGNKISFFLDVVINGTDMKFNYTGELSGEKLNLRFEMMIKDSTDVIGRGSFIVERVK